ncbi:hypothetical protein DQ04_01661100 [Trypanosoma grayi]|uniref:hypothetical protein n=1 Tax=Trypanosoma grayi TaxID=71804 RepID=UPI0004F48BA3|nr:hypothetical protein DQ04_01661100 [Trypanosoma grayi]KEG12506.1 hypothetical protein DQ04_01661100 [Trypanosoma grayi]
MRFGEDSPVRNGGLPSQAKPQHPLAGGLALDAAASSSSTRKHVTVQEIVDRADAEADVAVVGRCCTTVFLPLLIVVLVLGVFLSVVLTSGSAPKVAGVPRAVLIVVEGFKGTTFNALLEGERLPHIRRMLLEQHGVYAACATLEDARCARAVLVEDDTTGEPFISSGAGIATILTGVTPRRHRVRNDSWQSYSVMADTTAHFPTIAMRVTSARRHVVALGTSHMLNALNTGSGQCSEAGLLDAECETPVGLRGRDAQSQATTEAERAAAAFTRTGDDASSLMSCLHQRSCNLFKRVLTLANGRDGKEEQQFTKYLSDVLGGLVNEEHESASSTAADGSLFIFHFNTLARRAGDAGLPDFTYAADSLEYTAQAFLLDSLIGQVLAIVRDRARSHKENWLVVGTSDHGGVGKSFGRNGDEDEVVPFFTATYTTNARGYTRLRSFTRPVTHMDAAPTILKWLGIAPYDDADDGDETTTRAPADPAAAGSRDNSKNTGSGPGATANNKQLLDGRPQGICGSGLRPRDCEIEEEE